MRINARSPSRVTILLVSLCIVVRMIIFLASFLDGLSRMSRPILMKSAKKLVFSLGHEAVQYLSEYYKETVVIVEIS